jgi:hypothetical protein
MPVLQCVVEAHMKQFIRTRNLILIPIEIHGIYSTVNSNKAQIIVYLMLVYYDGELMAAFIIQFIPSRIRISL